MNKLEAIAFNKLLGKVRTTLIHISLNKFIIPSKFDLTHSPLYSTALLIVGPQFQNEWACLCVRPFVRNQLPELSGWNYVAGWYCKLGLISEIREWVNDAKAAGITILPASGISAKGPAPWPNVLEEFGGKDLILASTRSPISSIAIQRFAF